MAITTKPKHLAGPDLRAERVRRGLTAIAVAARLGLSRQRVSQIERWWRVPPDIVAKYMKAIEELAA